MGTGRERKLVTRKEAERDAQDVAHVRGCVLALLPTICFLIMPLDIFLFV